MPIVTGPAANGAYGFQPLGGSLGGEAATGLYAVEATCPAIRAGDIMKFSTGGLATKSSAVTQPIGALIGFAAQTVTTSGFDGITPNLLIYNDPNAIYVAAMTSSEILLSSGVGSYYAWTNTTGGMSTGAGGAPGVLYSQMTVASTPLASTGATKGHIQVIGFHPLTAFGKANAVVGVSSSAAGATGHVLVRFVPMGSPITITS